ncbi:hypothetical protein Syun_031797 [Stephania yunnanensis]|uniref:Cytochrome P450 n=1 Tax=Stephania yunnanensis TaxID=152371 RepID=A0AAP0HEH0_9MAGN
MALRKEVQQTYQNHFIKGFTKPRNVPEPPGAWPIIGHLPLLVSAKQPHRAFAALAEKYGPSVRCFCMGMSPMLIMEQRERLLKNVTPPKIMCLRYKVPVTIAGKLMAYDHSGHGLLLLSGT